jgi:hypothetical protein
LRSGYHEVTAKRASKTAKPTRVFGQRQEPAKVFRAGLYARVSTHDQQTLSLQMRAMREYAAKRGWTIAAQIREVVPAQLRANSGRNCSIQHVGARAMLCWSGGWTAGAGRLSIWSSP